jgi:DNA-binding beta-propeller fold protein YncE
MHATGRKREDRGHPDLRTPSSSRTVNYNHWNWGLELGYTMRGIQLQFNSSLQRRLLLAACIVFSPGAGAQTTATFGEVITLGGTPSDIVLDEARRRLYLVDSPNNTVDVWDYSAKTMIGSISVGQNPLAAAMSMDGSFLYVTNHDSASLSVINLTIGGLGSVTNTAALPAKPQGVEVGADGRVLICTDGSGTSNTNNTLVIYDGLQASGNQVLPVVFLPPPATPASLPLLVATVRTPFNGKLLRTPDGKYIVGVSNITNNTNTVAYVYETASGTVLRSRAVVGVSTTLSMSPDGSSFMAGSSLFDIATLNVLAQQSTANAPFLMTAAFSATNVGGSVFNPNGSVLYSAFNIAATAVPAPAPQSTTLLLSDPRSLGISLGINLPESLIAKMVITSSGSDAWGLSSSGVLHLPLATLYTYPILMPDTTTVFLAQDDCRPGVATAKVHVNNIGGGTLTFAVPQVTAALEVSTSTGVAPGILTFTMDPGRSSVVRTPGTNLYSGTGIAANSGTAMNITLQSPNAINVLPTIRVFMNYRDSTQRGLVFPVPTGPNSNNAAAPSFQGLQDIVLDQTRNRVYITNPGYNRIEVFDTQKLEFQTPIPVGAVPHQMAMGLDGYTLYVANTASEQVMMVDLDQQQVIGSIQFPPIPVAATNGTTATTVSSPAAIAMGLSGLQILMSSSNATTATLWSVVGNQATPRVGTSITGVNSATGAQTPITGPTQTMLASDDGAYAILLAGNGAAYLYDGLNDAYTATHQLFTNPITSYYGPLSVAPAGSFLLANSLVVNHSLTPIGGYTSPGQAVFVPPTPGGGIGGIGVTSNGLRNVAAVAPVGSHSFVRMSTPVRASVTATTSDDLHTTLEVIDTQTGATAIAAEMAENPVISVFGTTRTALPPRQMVVDANGTVYTLTVSGLTVTPLTVASSATQPQIVTSRGVVNANDGTTNFKPGSIINVTGTNLASASTADTLPAPVVLGGSCVLIDNVAIPLISTSSGQIQAQIPAAIRPGSNVLQVRSLANAQRSNRVQVTIQRP